MTTRPLTFVVMTNLLKESLHLAYKTGSVRQIRSVRLCYTQNKETDEDENKF